MGQFKPGEFITAEILQPAIFLRRRLAAVHGPGGSFGHYSVMWAISASIDNFLKIPDSGK
jgi:hypothetical protein